MHARSFRQHKAGSPQQPSQLSSLVALEQALNACCTGASQVRESDCSNDGLVLDPRPPTPRNDDDDDINNNKDTALGTG